jgi:superfamily II DNA or RNA helicase
MHHVAGDFNRAEVATAMKNSTVVGDAVSTYQKDAAGGRALVFVWSLDASRALADAFTAAGIPATHVDGETPTDERKRAMAAFRAGSLRVLCNVDLFGEGLDVPAVDAVFLLRPTDSLGLYLQQCGRGLRPAPGKAAVRIFDHVGNWTRHGLPDEDRQWSLKGETKTPRETVAGRRCAECFAVSPPGARVCAACHAPFPRKPREIDQVDGALVEVDPDTLRQRALEYEHGCHTLHDWQELAKRKGYKSGWAWHQWKLSLGRAPEIAQIQRGGSG